MKIKSLLVRWPCMHIWMKWTTIVSWCTCKLCQHMDQCCTSSNGWKETITVSFVHQEFIKKQRRLRWSANVARTSEQRIFNNTRALGAWWQKWFFCPLQGDRCCTCTCMSIDWCLNWVSLLQGFIINMHIQQNCNFVTCQLQVEIQFRQEVRDYL